MRARFGVAVHEGYGLTEASPVVTTSAVVERHRAPGRSVHRCRASRCGSSTPTATTCSNGDPGEMLVRGPNVFAGYWDDPEATARVLDGDGWLHTGDIAVADDDGWLSLVERAKDVIIVSGFNVYPGEVEQVLAEHPDVARGRGDRRTASAHR